MAKDSPAPASTSLLKQRVSVQLALLIAQFLLGMAVNLIGEPESTIAKASHGILLGLHVLVAVGLVVGASLIMHTALKLGGRYLRVARLGVAGIGAGFLAGILTLVAPGGDWWSYLMSAAFIWAFAFFGLLFTKL
jgi:hypothetical protein